MNQQQRDEFLEQARARYAADILLKGTYGEIEQDQFRGCSVGCHAHHIRPDTLFDGNEHKIVADYYGYPEWLARLQDTIFERLPAPESAKWHVHLAETLHALPDDYDWQSARHRVIAAILRIALPHAGTSTEVVRRVIDLHDRAARGGVVDRDKWSEAATTAWAAVRAASEASEAAEAAVRAAAVRAATTAWAAAEAAAEAWVAWEAWAAWAAEAETAPAKAAATYQKMWDDILAALADKQPAILTYDATSQEGGGDADTDA